MSLQILASGPRITWRPGDRGNTNTIILSGILITSPDSETLLVVTDTAILYKFDQTKIIHWRLSTKGHWICHGKYHDLEVQEEAA